MPIKIQNSDPSNVSVHRYFWDTLTKNSDSLALSQLWLACFDTAKMRKIANKIQSELQSLYEPDMWSPATSRVADVVLNPVNFFGSGRQGKDAYLLTQGVSFIADGLNSSRVGSTQTGAMKGLIIDGRLDLNATNITFLETNVSFVDGFLRPWAALVGHKSLKDHELRLDIELICLEKWALESPLRIRKSMLFRNAVPINIDAEEYNYSGDKLIQRQVQFAFDRYDSYINTDISYASVTRGAALKNADIKPTATEVELKQKTLKFIEIVTPLQSTISQTNAESQAKIVNVSPDNLEMGDAVAFVDEKINSPSVISRGEARQFYNEVTPKSVSHEALTIGELIKDPGNFADNTSSVLAGESFVRNAQISASTLNRTSESTNTPAERVAKSAANDARETKQKAASVPTPGEESMIMENADFVLVEPTQSTITKSDLDANPNIKKSLDRANAAIIKSTGSAKENRILSIAAQNINTGSSK